MEGAARDGDIRTVPLTLAEEKAMVSSNDNLRSVTTHFTLLNEAGDKTDMGQADACRGASKMSETRRPEPVRAAQIRGDIQKGLSGDKQTGFDPAAAPLETDAEAAGTPLSQEEIRISRDTQARNGNRFTSRGSGTAMRPFSPASLPASRTWGWAALVTIAAVFALALLLFMVN